MAQFPERDPAAKPATLPSPNPEKPGRPAVAPEAAKRAPPQRRTGKPLPGPTAVPAAATRVSRAAPRRGFTITAEHGLAGVGIAIAIVSGCFGIYMNVRPEPEFAGSKYWSVFAQLRRAGPAAGTSSRSGDAGIDPVVTGSIPAAGAAGVDRNSPAAPGPSADAAGSNPHAAAPLKGYVVRDVFDGMALVESPYGLTLVKPGAVLLGAGQVTGMEMRAGKWVVLTSQGIIGTSAD
jgi:hypothetical protein